MDIVKNIILTLRGLNLNTGKVKGYIGEGKTLVEILNIKEINPQDRLWCVTKFFDDKTNRAFAIWCARLCKTDCKEVTDYIDVIERYYDGKATKEELEAADRAAYWAADRAAYRAADRADYWAAYWAADRAAYWVAYWAAYRAADREDYWAADRAADRADYWAADWAAYWEAYWEEFYQKIINHLIEVVEGL